jgi:glycosyltransferase involved in cell wall biosynthesis
MIDVIITTYNRVDFLKRTIESFIDKNKMIPYRLFVADDFSNDGTAEYLCGLRNQGIANILLSPKRNGVVYGFNSLWNWVDYLDTWQEESDYMCYFQDDLVSVKNEWLLKAIEAYEFLRNKEKIGFFSGCDAPEHPIDHEVIWNDDILLMKKSTSATNLIAEKKFWRSIGFVPRLNPDGTERGFPHKNKGSHIDVYLTGYYSLARSNPSCSAENCLREQNKMVMVLPSLEHLGHEDKVSTWRKSK